MMRFTTLALSLLAASFVGACGLKGDLYLPQQPATPSAAAPATPAAATKAGDDSKATNAAPAAK